MSRLCVIACLADRGTCAAKVARLEPAYAWLLTGADHWSRAFQITPSVALSLSL